MATINDFKLLYSSSLKYFELAAETQGFDESRIDSLSSLEKARFGFYYFILNKLTSLDDFDDMTSCICDQHFNLKIMNKGFSDEGIDAVYINEEDNEINIFNFKFREKFNPDKEQSKDEAILSSKFLSVLKTEKNNLEGPLKLFADQIIKFYNTPTEWKTNFYIVSNENRELNPNDKNLEDFAELFDVNIESIGLDKITAMMLPKHKSVSAIINLPSEAVMSYSESARSSNISYIVRMRLTDLIRITCNDESIRKNFQLEDDSLLANVKEEIDVLFDNVRGLILKSKYNKNIEETLNREPNKFFFFNNGLTVVAENIDYQELNSGKRIRLNLINFQVLNGGQTLRTIHLFNQKNSQYIKENLSKAEILVRILKITDDSLKNKIGEYTNSQNAIRSSDLKALRKEQLELDSFLASHGILYLRKRGDNENNTNAKYDISIGMERLGQILWTIQGSPEMVSNKKMEIFTTKYEDLFGVDDLISEKTINLIKKYSEIRKVYKSTHYQSTDQKCMYILYIAYFTGDDNYIDMIVNLEKEIDIFITKNSIKLSPARVLILPKFKEVIKSKFKIGD